nr:hypothetical protein [uncultured Oscillibacter sp.]
MRIKRYDTVRLKDGRKATIVEILTDTVFIADVGDGPENWDTIDITLDMVDDVIRG